jgi:hypothetical protein
MATAGAETSHDERVPPGGLVADDLLAPRLQGGVAAIRETVVEASGVTDL